MTDYRMLVQNHLQLSNNVTALTIAFRSFAAILIAYLIYLRIATMPNNTSGSLQRGLKMLSRNDFLSNKFWVVMLPAALAAAASFPMLLEGILHLPNLPVMVMLFVSKVLLR